MSWDKITHFYHSNEKTKPNVISSPYKYESVYLSYDVNYTFTIAVGDWVFSEDQKIKEYYQVSSHKSRVRMAEQIPTTARIWSNFFCLIKPFVLFWLQINERNTLKVRRKEMQAIHITRSKSWLIICTKVYKLEIKIKFFHLKTISWNYNDLEQWDQIQISVNNRLYKIFNSWLLRS